MSIGADVNATNNQKQTPFLISMACNDIRIVEALVAFSSDIHAKDSRDRTYEDIAAAHGKSNYIKYIGNIVSKKEEPYKEHKDS